MPRPKLLFVATEDWFFASHFLPMARAAREMGLDVAVIARERNHRRVIEATGARLIALEAERRSLDPRALFKQVAALKRIIAAEKPDVLHCIALKPIALAGLAGKLAGVERRVYALTGLGFLGAKQGGLAALARFAAVTWLRGAIDGIPSEGDAHPWRVFGEQLLQIIPPLTLIEAARRGPRALGINLAGAAIIAALAALLARATGNIPQFVFLGTGFYAVFSWACALRDRDRPTFALTWASPAFMGIVIAYGADCFVGYSVSYWAAPYAERAFTVDKAALGFLIGAPAALGGFLGAIFGGKLADMLQARFAAGRIMVIAIALVLPVPIMLVGYSTADPTLFFVLAFAVQLVTATALGASAAASQSLVLPRMRGVATGIFFLGTALLGLGLGPFLAGFVSEATGDLGLGVKSTLIAAPVGLIAMGIAIRAAPKAAATLLERARAAGEPI